MTFRVDSAAPVPPPWAADGARSALGAGHTWPADGAPGSVADIPAGLRNPALPAAGPAGGAAGLMPPAVWLRQPEFAGITILDPDGWRDGTPFDEFLDHDEFVRRLNRCTITGPVRPSQPSNPSAAADGASLVITDAPASPPDRGGGSGGDVTSDFDAHVDRALDVGGFGPRLVEPAPVADPALREPERVWIPGRRVGIDRHRLAPGVDVNDRGEVFSRECVDRSCLDQRAGYGHAHLPQTVCRRSIRTGELLPADDPWIVAHTQPCPRCWPGGA